MAKEIVTLYIDDNSIRLMVAQGKQITKWAESSLEPGVVEDNIILKEADVTAKIKQLFESQKIKNRRIVLGISGLRCLTRLITLPKFPKDMLDEAVRRELQRSLVERAVSLDELYLSWQLVPSTAEQTRVFMVGIPRKAIDSIFKVLHRAGLRVGFMQIKPVILARTVKETSALVVDVQVNEFDIVVMVDGIPHPVRSIRFATADLPSQEKLTTIKNEINRTFAFYNTNNQEKPLTANVAVLVSGNLANQPELFQTLSQEVGHPVLQLAPLLKCPEGLDPNHYMANIGLVVQATSTRGKPGATSITLNALPVNYQTRAVSLINVFAIPFVVVMISLLAFLVMFNQNVSSDITSLTTKLNTTNQLIQQQQIQRQQLSANITELQNKISIANALRNNLTELLGVLDNQAAATNDDLAAAMGGLPDRVRMSNLSYIDKLLTITGKAPSENQILDYITNLDSSGRFGNTVVTDMTRNQSGDIDFTIIGTVQTHRIGASSMEVALGSLPSSVNLTTVKTDGNTLNIDGIAPTSDKIFSYLRALEASGKFIEITIISITNNDAGGMDFSLILKTGG